MFEIADTEFGVDVTKTVRSVAQLPDADLEVRIDIRGDANVVKKLNQIEDSPWNWLNHPPHFYLRGRCSRQHSNPDASVICLKMDDLNECEVGLHLWEHHDFTDIAIEIESGGVLSILAHVTLEGTPLAGSPRELRIRV